MIVTYSAPPASAPDPRFHARSMLSLGTDDFFAFWMASYSVGLPSGSPPPVRAATSMFLISLANSLLRLASTTAFLCLVVAHLEWPLIGSSAFPDLGHHLDEVRVNAQVPGQLGVEGRREQVTLSDGDDPTGGRPVLDAAEHLDVRPAVLHPGRSDEHRVEGVAVDVGQVYVGLEGVDLPAERVATYGHVDPAQRLLVGRPVDDPVGEQDHPRAGPVRRQAPLDPLLQRLKHVEGTGQLGDGRRLPAGEDERVDLGELLGTAYRLRHRPRSLKRADVLADVPLQRKHTNRGREVAAAITTHDHAQPYAASLPTPLACDSRPTCGGSGRPQGRARAS